MTRARLAGLAAVLLLGGAGSACAPSRTKPAAPPIPLAPGHVPPAPPARIAADANLVVTVAEAVPGYDEDTGSYTAIHVDRREAGRTPVGPRSQERSWGARLAPGNHLFRFEHWLLSKDDEWAPLSQEWQPPERFIRVEEGSRTSVTLKFFEGSRRHSLEIRRAPLGSR